MTRNTLPLALAALVGTLVICPMVQAYGCCHAGYTHIGPNGVQHVGYTGGSSGGYHYGSTGGGYHYGSTGGDAYHYGTTGSGGYHYSGYHYGTTGGSAYHYGYHTSY
jgi:hypothetical protein